MKVSKPIACVLLGFPLALLAQQPPPPCCPGPECPSGKAIRMIVPFAAGGTADMVARRLALELQNSIGSPYVVENRPGAAGTIGADAAAKSSWQDTLLVTSSQLTVSAAVMPNTPYSIGRDLIPVAGVSSNPSVVAVPAASNINTLKDFIALANSIPGVLKVGTPGPATIQHLALAQLSEASRVRFTHVPYKGAGPAMADVAGGGVDAAVVSLAAAKPLVQSGKVKLLAVFSEKRLASAPELPTVAETTGQRIGAEDWIGVFAAAGAPADCTRSLGRRLNRLTQSPAFREALVAAGLVPAPLDPEIFAAVVKSDVSTWARVVKEAGIKTE
jgi:tripartite-type tricarboxylate transporter receptor subunit TctC